MPKAFPRRFRTMSFSERPARNPRRTAWKEMGMPDGGRRAKGAGVPGRSVRLEEEANWP
jgi:hypothetical protein